LAHEDCDVLVASARDFESAISIGMKPRFVEEVASSKVPQVSVSQARTMTWACSGRADWSVPTINLRMSQKNRPFGAVTSITDIA
jgi:hypothetical protein